jgi:hypothetical protein
MGRRITPKADTAIGLRVQTTTFETLDFFARCMNTHVGEGKWYIAGGCAAWLHIDNYADKEAADYSAFSLQIAPSDIEGGASEEGARVLHGRYGEMKVRMNGRVLAVSLNPKPNEQLEIQTALCVISPKNLIAAYNTAGNPDKREKRQLRVAIMTLMLEGKRITKGSVESKLQTAKPSIGQSILAGGFKLKSTGTKLF